MYAEAKKWMGEGTNVLIVSHKRPDGDTLGAALALKIWLENNGKRVTVACVDKPGPRFGFLPEVDSFVQEFDIEEFDLMIIVDAGASYMTDFHTKYENFFSDERKVINIDHHASNDYFGKLNIVEPEAASATMILYKMFNAWGEEINENMATCLLAGIYNDTGSFMHSNTDSDVMKMSGDLLSKGAQIGEIVKYMFKNTELSTLKLWGKVLQGLHLTKNGVVMSIVKDEDYDFAHATPEELSGVVDYLNMVPNSKFAVLVNEDGQGNVKGSFRTRKNDIDLSRIAAVFGGGGHPKASGFTLKGRLKKEVSYSIVPPEDGDEKELKF